MQGGTGDNPQQGSPHLANNIATIVVINNNDKKNDNNASVVTTTTTTTNNSSSTTNTYPTRIPPTVKDSRKLFVGGLPQDGTWLAAAIVECRKSPSLASDME